MVDVLSLFLVVFDVTLHMLQPYVEDLEGALDGVQLRQGQQLDLRSLGGATTRGGQAWLQSWLLFLCHRHKAV